MTRGLGRGNFKGIQQVMIITSVAITANRHSSVFERCLYNSNILWVPFLNCEHCLVSFECNWAGRLPATHLLYYYKYQISHRQTMDIIISYTVCMSTCMCAHNYKQLYTSGTDIRHFKEPLQEELLYWSLTTCCR